MVVVALAACGDPAHVRVVPLGGACAKPANANLVNVTAYAPGGDRVKTLALDEALAIGDFPADTEQLGIEVLVGGGQVGAAGKSAPLGFAGLGDGAIIPVAMAPLDGFCEVGAMSEPRAQPLIARAGDGALVVGGTGPAGPLSTIDYYDPATQAFTAIDVPEGLLDPQGFVGAALATLPDGRVAVTGGPRSGFAVFDPRTRGFTIGPVVVESRALHAAIATDDGAVILAGGCLGASPTGGCVGVARNQVLRYRLDALNAPDRALPTTNDTRLSARLFDLGVQLDGARRYLLAGGGGDPGVADRFALTDAATQKLAGGLEQPAALDGGAVLTIATVDAKVNVEAAVVSPEGAVRTINRAPKLPGVRLIALEDGRVAGFGGDSAGRVALYDPTRDAWTFTDNPDDAPGPGALDAPSVVRLADGAVLVVGGTRSERAWLFRPSLVGPSSGQVTALPASDLGRGVLTATDAKTVTRVGQDSWTLTATTDALIARALIGGPRLAVGSLRLGATVPAGGVAVIARQTGPGRALIAELVPERPARLVELIDGVEHEVCHGPQPLPGFDPVAPALITLAVTDHDAQLTLGGEPLLACGVAAGERGAWGVAALGAGAALVVNSVTVAR
jgi:hypothetical protein